MVQTFERVNNVRIPYCIAPRRDGDVASCFASPERAAQELGWTAQRDLDAMCASSWSFERTLAMRNSG
jgi:UDP-glucose 4-epimerase